MPIRRITPVLLAVLAASVVLAEGAAAKAKPGSPYDVRRYGTSADGLHKDTAAIQKAIDTCSASGGGSVFFPAGTYLSGSLHLKSGVTLRLDAGATILGSKDDGDYDPVEVLGFKNDSDKETSFFHYALIWGEGVERVGIAGEGTVDSNRTKRGGPKAIALKRCKYVDIKGVRVCNIPNYPISMLGTDYVNIDGVTILNGYADGIDPDACQNVRIANCHIESVDDCIVPKASFSLGERRASENITVTNCYLATVCNNFKLGTESGGDFKRIAVSNCVMTGLPGRGPASSGIAVESVDGSNVDGVLVTNCAMVDVQAPIFIRLGNRGRDMATPVAGTIKNVIISDVVATRASLASSITGIPGHAVEGVTLSNIRIAYYGGGRYVGADEAVAEQIKEYPDAGMFNGLPCYGLYCRHVSDLTLSNVRLSYTDEYWRVASDDDHKIQWTTPTGAPQPSEPGRPGPAMVCDDVTGLSVDGFRARPGAQDPVIRFINVKDTLVRGTVAETDTKVFLGVEGSSTDGVQLFGNALSTAERAVVLGNGVGPKAVRVDDKDVSMAAPEVGKTAAK